MTRELSTGHTKVGIVADSHGRPETIMAALAFMSGKNCRRTYHLGDICDSFRPETTQACLRPLQESNVRAIRGNNDHAIVANHTGQENELISQEALSFLRNLPLVKRYRNAVLAHSLPFARELGLACMIGTMGRKEAHKFFQASPHGILFRGHSHTPELLWARSGGIFSQTISAGQKVGLAGRLPCVVNCGALTRGLCMIWRPGENLIECHSFL